MSVTYAETYVVNGREYGIEDYDKRHKRFDLWAGDRSIGSFDNINDARKILYTHVVSHVRAEYAGHSERAHNAKRALDKLGDDPFHLGRFRGK